MPAANVPLRLERGVTPQFTFYVQKDDGTAWDLTGYTAKIEVRSGRPRSPDLVDAAVATYTSAGGKLVLGGAAGTVSLGGVTPTDTRLLVAGAQLCYDLRLYSSAGDEYRPAAGSVSVAEGITQP